MIDSHTHVDGAEFDGDRAEVLARARAAGVSGMVVVGTGRSLAQISRAVEMAAREPDVWAAVGVHPHDAKEMDESWWGPLEEMARAPRVVAVGETGLDFHYDHSPRETQREVFRRQVRLAREVGLPVVVHTREADDETASILEQEGASETGGAIHCFTGGPELARRALALGFLISFSGIVAFPRSEVIQQVAREVPEDRLLVETDAPFLAPPPHRGKRNEPAFVVEVARKLAALRGTSEQAIGEATRRNYARLFRRAL
jgi:TatD DNase family protein